MCNAWRHFIKDLGVGGGGEKKEKEDDRMRSGGERDWEWRWGGGEFRGVAPDRSSCHRTSTNSAPLLQFMLCQSAEVSRLLGTGMPIKSWSCQSKVSRL